MKAFLGSLFVVYFSSAVAVRACDCLDPLPAPMEEFDRSEAVFVGGVEAESITPGEDINNRLRVYTFRVTRAYKGDLDERVIVVSDAGPASCGRSFQIGEDYLVFASEYGSSLHLGTSACSRTSRATAVPDIIAQFEALFAEEIDLRIGVVEQKRTLSISNAAYQPIVVEASENLIEWTPIEKLIPESDDLVLLGNYPVLETQQAYFRARRSDREASQGIFGLVVVTPGVCFGDPQTGECLDIKSPGTGRYVIRKHTEEPDAGFSGPILRTFRSRLGAPVDVPLEFASSLMIHERMSDAFKEWLESTQKIQLSESARLEVTARENLRTIVDPENAAVYLIEDREAFIQLFLLGGYRVALPPGKYCIWDDNSCWPVEVKAGEWTFQELQLALP